MRLRTLLALLLCYLIWGMQPLYWAFLDGFDAMFILCARIAMSVVCTWLYLLCTGRLRELLAAFRNRALMRYLLPAALFLCADWGLFIWAVTSGHVLDSTLGYYLNPMVIFLMGVLLFHERGHALEYVAVGLACVGLVFSTVEYGSFPLVAVLFAACWPIYASIKKGAKADPIVSVAVEATLMLPFALLYALFFCRGAGGFASIGWGSLPLLLFSGVVTALPMILYTYVVNGLPFKLVGILQYAGTTLSFLCGVLFLQEEVTRAKLIMFAFIWAGLIVFTAGNFRRQGTRLPEEVKK